MKKNMNESIKIEHLYKSFGKTDVLQDISLSAHPSEIIGVTGRNGCGKTVLFKCICGMLKPSSGEIYVNGKQIEKDVDVPQSVGVLIENPAFLPQFSAYDNLRILSGINRKITDEQVKEVLESFGLDWKNKRHVEKYSMGMRQRLGLAQAVMEDPSVLILDEPMNSLDQYWVKNVREKFFTLKAQGKTILLASHYKEDVDCLCDRVVRLEKGRMIAL